MKPRITTYRETIEFAENFSKLHGQTWGELIYCEPITIENDEFSLCDEAREYDTDGKFDLKYGDYFQLVFIGNKDIPFTTYRKFNLENFQKYRKHLRWTFDFKIGGAK